MYALMYQVLSVGNFFPIQNHGHISLLVQLVNHKQFSRMNYPFREDICAQIEFQGNLHHRKTVDIHFKEKITFTIVWFQIGRNKVKFFTVIIGDEIFVKSLSFPF